MSTCARSFAALRTLAVLAAFAALGVLAPGALAAPTGAISGKVIDATTHEPIDDLEVCAFLMEASQEVESEGGYACAKSGSQGEYTISGLASGNFAVAFAWSFGGLLMASSSTTPIATPLNYVLQAYNDVLPPGKATPVAVSAGGTTSGIDAELQPGSEISGTITNAANGAPVQGALACALRAGQESFELVACALSQANGEYTLRGVPDGAIDVIFEAANLAAQFYPGKLLPTEASAVTISAAKEVKTAINAAMQPGEPEPLAGGSENSGSGSSGSTLPGGPLGGGLGGPLGARKLAVALSGRLIGVSRDTVASVRLACAGAANCRGKLVLTIARAASRRGKSSLTIALGAVRYSLRRGSAATVRIRLNATARRTLRLARGSLTVTLTIEQTQPKPARNSSQRVQLIEQSAAHSKR